MLEDLSLMDINEELYPAPIDMPEYSMGSLDKIIKTSRDMLHKYVLVHDVSDSKSSGVASYFSYKGRLFELYKELI